MKKLITLGLIFGASALSACVGSCGGQFVQSSYDLPPATCPASNCKGDPNDPDENPPSTFRSFFGGDRGPVIGTGYNQNQQQPQQGLFSNTPASGMMAPEQRNQPQSRGFFSNFQQQQTNRPNIQDVQLINRVRQALLNNHNIDARAIQVTSDNGTVTLIGLVRNDAARNEAENTAKNVEGVSSIDNKLNTQPTPNQNQNWNY